MEPIERIHAARTGSATAYEENSTIYRNGQNGFYEAVRLVTSHSDKNGQATDNTAEYEIGPTGTLELHSRTISRASKQPDGSSVTETDRYGKSLPGRASSGESDLKLETRDTITRKVASAGEIRETVAVRRANVSDPGSLGPPQVVSETICRGKCQ
jgi:hypothetical protein